MDNFIKAFMFIRGYNVTSDGRFFNESLNQVVSEDDALASTASLLPTLEALRPHLDKLAIRTNGERSWVVSLTRGNVISEKQRDMDLTRALQEAVIDLADNMGMARMRPIDLSNTSWKE